MVKYTQRYYRTDRRETAVIPHKLYLVEEKDIVHHMEKIARGQANCSGLINYSAQLDYIELFS
jgi:hypothetical protein